MIYDDDDDGLIISAVPWLKGCHDAADASSDADALYDHLQQCPM